MKSKSAKQSSKGPFAVRRVRVKGQRKVVLDEATYEALLRKADLWEPDLPASDARGNYPALECWPYCKPATFSVPAASWGFRKPSWPAGAASARKLSTALSKAGTSPASRPSPSSIGARGGRKTGPARPQARA